MENSTQANRATSPILIVVSTASLLNFWKQKVQSAKNTEIKSGRAHHSASCHILHSWDLNILASFTNLFFLKLAIILWYQQVTANILLGEYKKKNLDRIGKDNTTKHFQKCIVLYGKQEQVKEMCCTMLHGLFLKWTCVWSELSAK